MFSDGLFHDDQPPPSLPSVAAVLCAVSPPLLAADDTCISPSTHCLPVRPCGVVCCGVLQVFKLLKEFPNLAPVVAVTKVGCLACIV